MLPDVGYVLTAAVETEEEVNRLEDMHAAFSQYFGGNLGCAPLAAVQPRKILELGCGTGAWAIQAARQYPFAEVLAVDSAPLPDRMLPQNLKFQLADVTEQWNFEPETFDIVHARFLMGLVPDATDVISRVAQLVIPGGLLLIEEVDVGSLVATGRLPLQRVASKFIEILRNRRADIEIGRKLESIMTSLGYFQEVHVDKISAPFSGNTSDEATNQLGLSLKKFWKRGAADLGKRAAAHGITEEMIEAHNEELDEIGSKAVMDVYFCWACRTPA
ncbi:S-adenosyl-L-methionine-dependent methyltransferase [Mycena rebaudengoi]|nr:S-adenosyl-L-methionine-dependent methyltransferase [Mycena rebaudengoi]